MKIIKIIIIIVVLVHLYYLPRVLSLPNKIIHEHNKKIALCVSGELRHFDKCYKYWKQYIDLDNIDVFAYITETNDSKYDYFKKTMKPKLIVRDNNCTTKCLNSTMKNSILMFEKIYKCNNLKKKYENMHNFKYDCVIRIRPDLIIRSGIPVYNAYKYTKNIFIPRHISNFVMLNILNLDNMYGIGICDQLAFGSSYIMDVYSDMYKFICNTKIKTICVAPEYYLSKYLKYRNVTHKFVDINFVIYAYDYHNIFYNPIDSISAYIKYIKKSKYYYKCFINEKLNLY